MLSMVRFTSHTYHIQISYISHTYLIHITYTSHKSITYTSHTYHIHISYISHKYLIHISYISHTYLISTHFIKTGRFVGPADFCAVAAIADNATFSLAAFRAQSKNRQHSEHDTISCCGSTGRASATKSSGCGF